jgi:hypothetical protein
MKMKSLFAAGAAAVALAVSAPASAATVVVDLGANPSGVVTSVNPDMY